MSTMAEEGNSEKEKTEMPPDWEGIPIKDFLKRGFSPYQRVSKNGKIYITLKRGKIEKGLGPFTEEKWALLNKMYEEVQAEMRKQAEQSGAKLTVIKNPLLSSSLTPPTTLAKQINVSTKTLLYYEWARSKGYNKQLGDFLNEVCYAYFTEHGIEPVIVVPSD